MNKQPSRKKNAGHNPPKAKSALRPGVPLYTRTAVMKDALEVNGSSILGNGAQRVYATPNGVFTPDATTPKLPQPKTFDEWALMFEFY